MNECDWQILVGNDERINSHCLIRVGCNAKMCSRTSTIFHRTFFAELFQIPNDYFSNETLFNAFTLRTKIGPGQSFHEAATLGRRYTAKEALEARIVQAVTREANVVPDAKQMARKAIAHGGYKRKSLLNMKKDIYNSLFDLQDVQDRRPFLKSAI